MQTTTSPSRPPPQTPESDLQLAAELEWLSIAGIIAVNDRDWDLQSPHMQKSLEHLAPDFEAQHDNFPARLSFAENMASSRFLAEQDPSFHLEIVNISTNIQESRTLASVWLEMDVTGINPGVTMKGFSELKWRLSGEDGKWYCYRHLGMRGSLMSGGGM